VYTTADEDFPIFKYRIEGYQFEFYQISNHTLSLSHKWKCP